MLRSLNPQAASLVSTDSIDRLDDVLKVCSIKSCDIKNGSVSTGLKKTLQLRNLCLYEVLSVFFLAH